MPGARECQSPETRPRPDLGAAPTGAPPAPRLDDGGVKGGRGEGLG